MSEVSNRLRAARERAGLDLEDVSASTKIKIGFLRAIERGDFDRLPGEFFTRAFLRTYAREVGLPPEEIVHAYDSDGSRPHALAESFEVASPERPAGTDEARPKLPLSRGLWAVGALAAVILILVAIADVNQPAAVVADEGVAVGTTGIAKAAPVPDASAAAPQAAPERLTVEIRPSAHIWVAAEADGERVVYRLLEPGENVRVEARDALSFRVGDAGAFAYSINGAPGRPVGGPGEVRAFRITRDNYLTFAR